MLRPSAWLWVKRWKGKDQRLSRRGHLRHGLYKRQPAIYAQDALSLGWLQQKYTCLNKRELSLSRSCVICINRHAYSNQKYKNLREDSYIVLSLNRNCPSMRRKEAHRNQEINTCHKFGKTAQGGDWPMELSESCAESTRLAAPVSCYLCWDGICGDAAAFELSVFL